MTMHLTTNFSSAFTNTTDSLHRRSGIINKQWNHLNLKNRQELPISSKSLNINIFKKNFKQSSTCISMNSLPSFHPILLSDAFRSFLWLGCFSRCFCSWSQHELFISRTKHINLFIIFLFYYSISMTLENNGFVQGSKDMPYYMHLVIHCLNLSVYSHCLAHYSFSMVC